MELGITTETEEGSRSFIKVTLGADRYVEPGSTFEDTEKELFRDLEKLVVKRSNRLKRRIDS